MEVQGTLPNQIDEQDWGGCGCFMDDGTDAEMEEAQAEVEACADLPGNYLGED